MTFGHFVIIKELFVVWSAFVQMIASDSLKTPKGFISGLSKILYFSYTASCSFVISLHTSCEFAFPRLTIKFACIDQTWAEPILQFFAPIKSNILPADIFSSIGFTNVHPALGSLIG